MGGEIKKVFVFGAGKIGALIACLLAEQEDYRVTLADSDDKALDTWAGILDRLHTVHLNAQKSDQVRQFFSNHRYDALISALPFYCNRGIAEIAVAMKLPYFDLTEDIEVARYIQTLSSDQQTTLVPQCGLAPGIISIVANDLMGHFEELETVKLRVGALPVHPSNVLKYSLTWSTDGLINEYSNRCYGIEDGHEVALMPLEGYETIELDGLLYEAFNTSGGIGSLADTYQGKVKTLNYKTLRYPGHCEKIHFIMHDLKLKEDRTLLKAILENAIPKTLHDVVLIYVSVSGRQNGELFEENYVNKIYPSEILGKLWSAIQITTAAGVCAITDLVLQHRSEYRGFITQERFHLDDVLNNRFGGFYQ